MFGKQGYEAVDFLTLGIVTEPNVGDSANSVKVKLVLHDNIIIQARMMALFAGKDCGVIAKPSKGEEVIVAFANGNLDQAVVLGSLYSEKTKVKNLSDSKNEKKYVKFASGADLEINKSGCIIKTSKEHTVNFDDKNEKLSIKSKNGKMTFTIGFKSNDININCKEMKIKAGKSSLTLNDSGISIKNTTGKCAVDVKDFKVNAKTKAEIKSTGGTKVTSSANVDVKATGILNLKGSIAKIN